MCGGAILASLTGWLLKGDVVLLLAGELFCSTRMAGKFRTPYIKCCHGLHANYMEKTIHSVIEEDHERKSLFKNYPDDVKMAVGLLKSSVV